MNLERADNQRLEVFVAIWCHSLTPSCFGSIEQSGPGDSEQAEIYITGGASPFSWHFQSQSSADPSTLRARDSATYRRLLLNLYLPICIALCTGYCTVCVRANMRFRVEKNFWSYVSLNFFTEAIARESSDPLTLWVVALAVMNNHRLMCFCPMRVGVFI